MAAHELAERLLDTPALRRDLTAVTLWTTAEQFPALSRTENLDRAPSVELNYLLTCASILALSDSAPCQDAALRIAHFILSSDFASAAHKDAAAVVLDELTNTPALRLAEQRNLLAPNPLSRIPFPLRLDALLRAATYSELDPDGETVKRLNRFQKQVYDGYRDADWLSISAPTSAGKTYAVLHLMREFMAASARCIAITLVPTRALIQQIEGDLRAVLRGLEDVLITSVPQLPAEWQDRRMAFVFTQERLELLLNDAPSHFSIDFVVVDEAQKVGDGARGVLLQDVLQRVIRLAPRARIFFSSPMTRNPEILLEDAPPTARTHTIASEQIAVNQNLLWVSQQQRDTRSWRVSQCIGDLTLDIGDLRLTSRPTSESKRLPMVAHALTPSSGGSIVYVDGAAAAEKAAQLLWDMQGPNVTTDAELDALVDLTRNVIHEHYALVQTLERRVAFHYGNMPLIVRSEVERLFRAGSIRFLVCTSTLIEGVNLPAQSIFLRGPKKGRTTPMGEMDFWNLAGRAGRLGKEFQGNVICVDPDQAHVWKNPPPRKRTRYTITRSLDGIVLNRADDLATYIKSGTPRNANSGDVLEHAFVHLYAEHRLYGTLAESPRASRFDPAFVSMMTGLLAGVAAQVDIPDDIVFRNPGVSPIAQQELLTYFRSKGSEIGELIPAFPEDREAAQRYVKVIGRISTYLSGDAQALNWPHAILVVNWMRGRPLAHIIKDAAEYWITKRKSAKTLHAVIRETMRDVEEFARFRFAKYSSCYVEVLRHHLMQIGQQDRVEEIPQLNMWLEFGASQGTQIALMGLGLSRTTAIHLSDIIAADNLDMEAALAWLSDVDLNTLDLSPIMLAEIRRVRSPGATEEQS